MSAYLFLVAGILFSSALIARFHSVPGFLRDIQRPFGFFMLTNVVLLYVMYRDEPDPFFLKVLTVFMAGSLLIEAVKRVDERVERDLTMFIELYNGMVLGCLIMADLVFVPMALIKLAILPG